MSTKILTGFKIQGQTAASAAIATVVINYNSDGTLDYVDAQGDTIVYNGDNAEINKLLEMIFTGAAGLNGTKVSVTGYP